MWLTDNAKNTNDRSKDFPAVLYCRLQYYNHKAATVAVRYIVDMSAIRRLTLKTEGSRVSISTPLATVTCVVTARRLGLTLTTGLVTPLTVQSRWTGWNSWTYRTLWNTETSFRFIKDMENTGYCERHGHHWYSKHANSPINFERYGSVRHWPSWHTCTWTENWGRHKHHGALSNDEYLWRLKNRFCSTWKALNRYALWRVLDIVGQCQTHG